MKKLFKFLFFSAVTLLSTLSSAFAQSNFNLDWFDPYQHTSASSFSNEGRKVVVDNATGNIFTLADVTSNVDVNGNVTGNLFNYVVVVKYNSSGTIMDSRVINVNQHTVTGFNHKSAFGLKIDPAGNIYIGYNIYNLNTKYDVVLAKYTSALNPLWTYTYNNTTDDRGVDMTISSGSIIAAIGKYATSGVPRYAIISASGTGTSNLALYSLTPADVINSIGVDAGNNIYMTGYRTVTGKKNFLTISLNSSGVTRWTRQDYNDVGNGDNIGKHLIVGSDGFVYVTGTTIGTIQHGVDAVTYRFAGSNGKLSWRNIINYNLSDGGVKLVYSAPNIVYIGWTAGSTIFVDMVSSDLGTMLRRTSYAPIPTTPYNGLSGADISDMLLSTGKRLYLTGSVLAIGAGNQQFVSGYLIKLDFSQRPTGSSLVDQYMSQGNLGINYQNVAMALDNTNTQVYLMQDHFATFATHANEYAALMSINAPHSFRTVDENSTETPEILSMTFYSQQSGISIIEANFNIQKIEIFDITGKLVYERSSDLGTKVAEVETGSLKNGIYISRIHTVNGKTASKKFIIE